MYEHINSQIRKYNEIKDWARISIKLLEKKREMMQNNTRRIDSFQIRRQIHELYYHALRTQNQTKRKLSLHN
jgi:hypothetical protein